MSGSRKYRVEQNKQFLGHFGGHSPYEAVNAAYNKNANFYYGIDKDGVFDVYRFNHHWIVDKNTQEVVNER